MEHKEDATDPVIPLMIWIAYEPRFVQSPSDELAYLKTASAGNALIIEQIIPRAMRRLVASGKAEHLAACVAFIADLKDAISRKKAVEGLAEACKGRLYDAPANWNSLDRALSSDADPAVRRLAGRLAIAFRDPVAHEARASPPLRTRQNLSPIVPRHCTTVIGVLRPDAGLPLLLGLLKSQTDPALQSEALRRARRLR